MILFKTHKILTFKKNRRVQNLDSIVKPDDRELPIVNLKGDVGFQKWLETKYLSDFIFLGTFQLLEFYIQFIWWFLLSSSKNLQFQRKEYFERCELATQNSLAGRKFSKLRDLTILLIFWLFQANSVNSIDSNCDGWHSSTSDKVGLGSSLLGNKLLDQEMYSCQQKNIVLCIEVLQNHQETRKKRDSETESVFIESFNKYLEDIMWAGKSVLNNKII